MKILFFQRNKTQNKELEECISNLQTIKNSLYNKFGNDETFLNYLVLTNQKDIVDCFSKPHIYVNYDNIVRYINENVNTLDDVNLFFKEIEEQAHEILQ